VLLRLDHPIGCCSEGAVCYDDELEATMPVPGCWGSWKPLLQIAGRSASTVSINGRGSPPTKKTRRALHIRRTLDPRLGRCIRYTVFFTLLFACESLDGCSAASTTHIRMRNRIAQRVCNHPEIKALVIDPNRSESRSATIRGSNVGRNPCFYAV